MLLVCKQVSSSSPWFTICGSPAGVDALCHPEAASYERWHHQAASSAVCCEEERRENPEELGQQLHAPMSLRLPLEVFIREELEF
ncbi:uncharacterized protein V6R79_017700 [Siganus canaliculatus]